MKANTIKLIALASSMLSYSGVHSQGDSVFRIFTSRDFNKPFVSEISSTLNNLSFGYVKTSKVSGRGEKDLTVNEVHLGIDLPLLYARNPGFKWAVSIPISTHMVWYPLEEITSPIINNDYRFGFAYSGHVALKNNSIKNVSFEVKPFAHESTHLGDEFTITGLQEDTSFYRVNVSYEYYELSLTVNDPEASSNTNNISVKVGFMGLINTHKGYYSLFENEIGNKTLYPSRRSGEFYVDVDYKKVKGFLTSSHWQPNISMELRNRVKYNYQATGKENRVWCFNVYAGYTYVSNIANTIKSIGHYFRYYNGLNPCGQFRNGMCTFIGYSLIVKY